MVDGRPGKWAKLSLRYFFRHRLASANRVLDGRVLLPILGRQYSQVLEAQELRLTLEEGGFFIKYYDHKFSLDPKSYKDIMSHRPGRSGRTPGRIESRRNRSQRTG